MKKILLLSGLIFISLVGSLMLLMNETQDLFTQDKEKIRNQHEITADEKESEEYYDEGDFAYFKEINEDVVFALYFTDRVLPVVYNRDNEFYVRRDLAKKNSSMGTPFVDKYSGLNGKNILIHAHSSLNNERMFTFFKYFCDQKYYDEHSFFLVEDEKEIKEMEIFAVMRIDLNHDDYRDWMKHEWRNDVEFMNFIKEIKKRSLIESNLEIESDDSIMTLVTCDMNVDNGRFLVFAKEIENKKENS